MSTAVRYAALAVVLAGTPGCRELNPEFDEPVGSSSMSSSPTTVSSTAPTGPIGTDSATSPGTGSAGSTGLDEDSSTLDDSADATTGLPCESGSCLVERGLVTRYFIDEAADGTRPALLRDSAPVPLDLILSYEPEPKTMAETELSFAEDTTGRSLAWDTARYDSRASVLADSTKLFSALEGSTTATIEVVVRMSDVHDQASRIIHIGSGSQSGWLTLSSRVVGVLEFRWHEEITVEQWNIGGSLTERHVVHVVLNTDDPDPDARLQMYFDGELFPSTTSEMTPAQGETILMEPGLYYVLGNREIGGRSFQGNLYYAALYSSALSADEIANNAQRLLANDDP